MQNKMTTIVAAFSAGMLLMGGGLAGFAFMTSQGAATSPEGPKAPSPSPTTAAPSMSAALDAPGAMAVQEGDNVTFRYTMFNESGSPIFTNQYAMALIINHTDPSYVLLDNSSYPATTILIGEGGRLFGKAFEQSLIGRSTGETFQTALIPSNDSITGAYGTSVRLPRYSAPFALEETVETSLFQARFPNATQGSVVQLNPRFHVEIVSMDDASTTFRYLVRDGEQHAYPELGPTARLTTLVDPAAKAFRDRIDIEEGAKFHRRNDRILNLTHGYYFVKEVGSEAIVLDSLKAPFFNHTFQDVYFVVEIVNIEAGAR